VLNEAALEAVRRDGSDVTQQDVYNAVDRVLQASVPGRQPVSALCALCSLCLGSLRSWGRGRYVASLSNATPVCV
jgi:hypothetical protein